ncbi:MAG: hypothetical protein PHW10_02600 [Candidatus Peribacteraceae bacterium]|nr:hypothetical protein [Candidatus Peribacteraceae bacterium]
MIKYLAALVIAILLAAFVAVPQAQVLNGGWWDSIPPRPRPLWKHLPSEWDHHLPSPWLDPFPPRHPLPRVPEEIRQPSRWPWQRS